jgi:short-subunit dehydrogenase
MAATGASKGLGLALVQKLQNGFAVAATSRSAEALKKAVRDHQLFTAER